MILVRKIFLVFLIASCLLMGARMISSGINLVFIKHNTFTQSFFCSVYGDKVNVLSRSKFSNSKIKFSFKENLPTGVYRLYLSDSVAIDLIIGRDKEIKMESDAGIYLNKA